ncbi:MAG: sodium-coupled permease [Planctomyces sp.]|nr:sodium-coupled permease [Planctomyces sp.]
MTILDWLVLGIYASTMLGVGWYYSRKNRTAEDFLLGGRRMSPITVGLSLFATLVSALSYLANPGEMVSHGPMMATQLVAHPLIFLIVGYFLIPKIMKQPVTSAYEILETRLGSGIRFAGAAVFLMLRFGWLATILFATSQVVLVPLLRVDEAWIPAFCILLGTVVAVYSSIGGIKAVVITDAIQSVTMLAGAVLTILVVSNRMGGFTEWWPQQWPEHWQKVSWGFDPTERVSFGILFVSTTLWYVCTNGSDQMSIQRFLSTRDANAARTTLAVSQIADVAVSILLGITGIAILGFYVRNPERLTEGVPAHEMGDQLFPRFIMSEMPSGLSGLVLAAILSAALSSLSSGVNSICAVIERDIIGQYFGARVRDGDPVRRLMILTALVTLLAVSLSLLNLFFVGNLLERCFKVINLLTAPLFVLFFLALFVPWANSVGAWCGLVVSIIVAVLIAYTEELALGIPISFVWIIPCSLLSGVVVGSLVSYLTPRRASV